MLARQDDTVIARRPVDRPPAVRLAAVSKTFGEQSQQPYQAIAGLELEVAPGEFLAIVGPSGCGKSSLLRMLAGLDHPSSGDVLIDAQPVRGVNAGRVGFLFQQDALLPWRTVRQNVALGLLYRQQLRGEAPGAHGVQSRELVQQWIARVGLVGFEERYPAQLSGGMRKRVAIAQTLIGDPQLLLMDEPFTALDAQSRQLMEEELLVLCGEGSKTILFVTHDLDEAVALADRIALMTAGPRSHVKCLVPVDIPRPRNLLSVRHHPRFAEVTARLWEHLYEEVRKVYGR